MGCKPWLCDFDKLLTHMTFHGQAVERQAAAGVAEADSLLLVVDGQEGLTASDEEIIAWLRRKHPSKPITLAVNKCENVRIADTQVISTF